MSVRAAVAASLLVLSLTACGGEEEAKPENCLGVSTELGEAIAGGGTDGDLVWVKGAAVKSPDHKEVYYIAGVVKDPAVDDEEVTAVWGTTSLEVGGGMIVSADNVSELMTNWPRSDERTGDIQFTDPGGQDAKKCLGWVEPRE